MSDPTIPFSDTPTDSASRGKRLASPKPSARWTLQESARALDVSEATVRNWIKSGLLTPVAKHPTLLLEREVEALRHSLINGSESRLRRRANKRKNDSFTIPPSLVGRPRLRDSLTLLLRLREADKLSENLLLTGVILWLLERKGEAKPSREPNSGSISLSSIDFRRPLVRHWILRQNDSFGNFNLPPLPFPLREHLQRNLPALEIREENELLGHAYTTLMDTGTKSRGGMFFTPQDIVEQVAKDHVSEDLLVLDPCCGTGRYLLGFASTGKIALEHLTGIDISPMAAFLCGLQLLLAFPSASRPPSVYCADSLSRRDWQEKIPPRFAIPGRFDLVATNPPWGSLPKESSGEDRFPMLSSREIYSRFVVESLRRVRVGGHLSFLLPESFAHVASHRDLRKYLVENAHLQRIDRLGSIFGGVMTPVFRVDLKKEPPKSDTAIEIGGPDGRFHLRQGRISHDRNYRLPVHLLPAEREVFEKMLASPHSLLGEHADWALGIVTGDNRKHLHTTRRQGEEPIYRGSEVHPFFLSTPERFISFCPEKFQQVASETKYRAPEKLIYRFVSRRLIVAWDNRRSLTLNSANLCLPHHPVLSVKALAAYLNSSVAQFFFQARCNALKILRRDLEILPIPHLLHDLKTELHAATERGHRVARKRESRRVNADVDRLLFERFELTHSEKRVIADFLERLVGKKLGSS